MANLITDGFDWFPTGQSDAARQTLWAANTFFWTNHGDPPQANVTTGRFSFGQCMSFNYSMGATLNFFGRMNGYCCPFLPQVQPATGFIGAAVYVDSEQHSTAAPCLAFYDAVTNDFQCAVQFEPNGVVRAYLGNPANGNVIQASVAGCFQEDQWFHVEIKGHIANSGGTLEVRINTVPVLQIATADTTGSSNNDWSGNLRVKTQFMTANGATNNFTIGGSSPAATNWQSVLNTLLNDTKFVYDSNVGDIDLYTPDPNLNAPLVRCVQVRMALRQDDATQRVARALLRISGVNYPGTVDQYVNQTYTFYKERWQLSPATGVTFTGSEVNGLQAGVKVQA